MHEESAKVDRTRRLRLLPLKVEVSTAIQLYKTLGSSTRKVRKSTELADFGYCPIKWKSPLRFSFKKEPRLVHEESAKVEKTCRLRLLPDKVEISTRSREFEALDAERRERRESTKVDGSGD